MDLPIEDYFVMLIAVKLKSASVTLLMEWLPDDIVDAHAHCNLRACRRNQSSGATHMLSTFPYFTLEDSERQRTMFFPGKKLRSLRFAKTFRGLNHRAANDYLLERSP